MTIRRHGVRAVLALVAGLSILSWATATYAQSKKSDVEEIQALVAEYTRYEDSGDMASQAKLMTSDRWWHGVGGRHTDNPLYMKIQEEQMAQSRKRYPGLQNVREVRDLMVKLIAPTVAVSSFLWVNNRIIPGDLPADKITALGPAPIPTFYSLVWVRRADGWRIASTHSSPLYLR